MVVSIKRIIDVSTAIAAAAQGRRNFANALVIQKAANLTNAVKAYSSPSEILADLGSNSEAYKASLKFFAGGFNGIRPNLLYIASVNSTGLTDSTQGVFVSGDASANLASLIAVSDGSLTLSKDGSSAIAVPAVDLTTATTFVEVAALLQTRIRQANTAFRNISVSYATGEFTFTSETYGSSSKIVITAGATGTDLTAGAYLNGGASTDGTTGSIAAVIDSFLLDNRYYHIILSNDWTEEQCLEWSQAVEASSAIAYLLWILNTNANIADQDLATDTTSIARILFDRKATHTVLSFDDTNVDYKQASFPSYFATVQFNSASPLGSLTWKQFSNISPTELTTNQFNNLKSKYVNFYTAYGEIGRNIAYEGRTSSGAFICDVIGADWVGYTITYNIFDMQITLPKLAYTVSDFGKLYQCIDRAFLAAFSAVSFFE